jgi:hypothetical protein
MIPLREVLVRPGIVDSARVCALPVPCQLFFRNLLHACDGGDTFPADAEELRAAFYWRSPGVSRPHVEAWLTKCHQAGLVKLFTSGGKPFGELLNYHQRDTKRRKLYPARDAGELNFAAAPPEDGPRAGSELNRIEGRGEAGAGRPAEGSPARARAHFSRRPSEPETEAQWRERLAVEWPELNLDEELRKARQNRGIQGKALERAWFERHWLPGCSPVVGFATAKPQAIGPVMPLGWKTYLNETYPDSAYSAGADREAKTWEDLPRDVQAMIAREMAQGRAKAS